MPVFGAAEVSPHAGAAVEDGRVELEKLPHAVRRGGQGEKVDPERGGIWGQLQGFSARYPPGAGVIDAAGIEPTRA